MVLRRRECKTIVQTKLQEKGLETTHTLSQNGQSMQFEESMKLES